VSQFFGLQAARSATARPSSMILSSSAADILARKHCVELQREGCQSLWPRRRQMFPVTPIWFFAKVHPVPLLFGNIFQRFHGAGNY